MVLAETAIKMLNMATAASDPFDLPERAICAFEDLADVSVTVHDLDGSIWPYIAPSRHRHRGAFCDAVKYGADGHKCLAFDVETIRQTFAAELTSKQLRMDQGFVKLCHAGLVEAVVPVAHEGHLRWVLFAGQRLANKQLQTFFRDPQRPTPITWPGHVLAPETVDDRVAQRLLEGLRQLAARLQLWAESRQSTGESAARPAAIRRFIAERHRDPVQIADLAAVLGVSETRAVHLVGECCGQSFQNLLTEARLSTAAALLRTSSWAISDVAVRAGWRDLSRFHRVFRQVIGCTPLHYRKLRETPGVASGDAPGAG